MKTIQLGETKRIHVIETGQFAGCFDRACARARADAERILGADDSGNMSAVAGWQRSECYIEVQFITMSMTLDMCGGCYDYVFGVTPRRTDDS